MTIIEYDPINTPHDIPPIVHIRTYYDESGFVVIDPTWEFTYTAIYLTHHVGSSLYNSNCCKLDTILTFTKWWLALQTLTDENFHLLRYYNQTGVYYGPKENPSQGYSKLCIYLYHPLYFIENNNKLLSQPLLYPEDIYYIESLSSDLAPSSSQTRPRILVTNEVTGNQMVFYTLEHL